MKGRPIYEIGHFMVFGTSHITKDDCQFLEDQAFFQSAQNLTLPSEQFLTVISYKNGFIVSVPAEEDEAGWKRIIASELSEACVNLLKIASTHDCRKVIIDQDGPVYDNLPIIDW